MTSGDRQPPEDAPASDLEPGREIAGEEPSGGILPASDELEAALREATESVESIHAERAGPVDSGGSSPDKIVIEALSEELQSLKKGYEELTTERDELKERLLRLQAEFENFRRRNLKERQEAHNFGHQNLVKDLLPSVDNLERAIAYSEGSDGGDLQGLLKGIELVQKQLLALLAKHGVKRVEAKGQPFDPAVHEAMAQVENDGVPANTIVEVLEEGYQLHDRMLRPSRVMVSRKSAEASAEAEEVGSEAEGIGSEKEDAPVGGSGEDGE